MQDGWDVRHLRGKFSHAGNAEAKNSDRAIPAAHDFCRLEAIVKNLVGVSVIEAATNLTPDIEQVPDGKSFFAGQHSSDAVALDVFHGGAEPAINFSGAVHGREVGIAEDLGGLGLGQKRLLQFTGGIAKGGELNRLERDGLAGLRIIGFVNRASSRL